MQHCTQKNPSGLHVTSYLCLCELRGLGINSGEMKPTDMNSLRGQRSILFWGDNLLFELPLYTSPLKANDLELAHRTPLVSRRRNLAFVLHQEVSFVMWSRFCNLAPYSKIKMQHVFWIYGVHHLFYVLKIAHHLFLGNTSLHCRDACTSTCVSGM